MPPITFNPHWEIKIMITQIFLLLQKRLLVIMPTYGVCDCDMGVLVLFFCVFLFVSAFLRECLLFIIAQRHVFT